MFSYGPGRHFLLKQDMAVKRFLVKACVVACFTAKEDDSCNTTRFVTRVYMFRQVVKFVVLVLGVALITGVHNFETVTFF